MRLLVKLKIPPGNYSREEFYPTHTIAYLRILIESAMASNKGKSSLVNC